LMVGPEVALKMALKVALTAAFLGFRGRRL
jgi:hypothetical protein